MLTKPAAMLCVLCDVVSGSSAVDPVRPTQSYLPRGSAVLRGWQMCHVRSTAAHSASVDVSDSCCILRLLARRSYIYCYAGYEFDD